MLKLFTWIFLLQLEYKLRILEFSAKYYDLNYYNSFSSHIRVFYSVNADIYLFSSCIFS